jgi:hypothetical protein
VKNIQPGFRTLGDHVSRSGLLRWNLVPTYLTNLGITVVQELDQL